MEKKLAEDILQWDVKSWSKALDYWEQNSDWTSVHHALELGGQKGGLSLWLALKGIEVVCSDLEHVEVNARPLHEKYGVTSKIQYQNIDATQIPYENHFDVIVFKSIIGGIGRNDNKAIQQQVFDQIHKALKPGGKLLFAENLIASPLHRTLRKKFVNWGGSWRYITVNEMDEFLRNFSTFERKTTGFLGTFGRSESQRKLLSTVDNWIFNHLCPNNYHYIVYGIAEK